MSIIKVITQFFAVPRHLCENAGRHELVAHSAVPHQPDDILRKGQTP